MVKYPSKGENNMKKYKYLLTSLLLISLSACDIEIILPSSDASSSDNSVEDYDSSSFISSEEVTESSTFEDISSDKISSEEISSEEISSDKTSSEEISSEEPKPNYDVIPTNFFTLDSIGITETFFQGDSFKINTWNNYLVLDGYGRIVYTLDIYGQVDNSQIEWFEILNKRFPNYVRYCGYVDSDKSVEVLKQYFALLFPTYYEGEGFAGTVIDAFASGVPVIASDWKYNTEVIKVGFDGAVFPAKDTQALVDKLVEIYKNIDVWNAMKLNCLKRAKEYSSENVIRILIEQLY